MEDLEKLEREKDAELASIAARIEQIETLANARKSVFQRESEQLKELFSRSLENLESTLVTSKGKLSDEVQTAGKNLDALEGRLQEILQETSLPVVERKLKALEEGIVKESAVSQAARLETASQEIKAMHGQMEERIAQKAGQITHLKGQLAAKEKELYALTGRLESDKTAMLVRYKTALDRKEKGARQVIHLLETELTRRNLRLQEVTKIIEAREAWIEQEKGRRLESLKALLGELETRGREFQEKMAQEKTFWESHIKGIDQEIVSLNMKTVTGQAELSAYKSRSNEDKKKLETELQGQIREREEGP